MAFQTSSDSFPSPPHRLEGQSLVPALGPGVHSAPALLAGTVLEGVWINRTEEYLAKQRGATRGPQSFRSRKRSS
jgi:hypothetical protein